MEVRSHTKHEWISLICALLEPAVLLFKQFLTLFTWKLVVCVCVRERERENLPQRKRIWVHAILIVLVMTLLIQAGSKD